MKTITETAGTLIEGRVAIFDEDKLYRFFLSIIWDQRLPMLVALMLNPSTADHLKNDPTVERICRRAAVMRLGGAIILNAFAWRETDRLKMLEVDDPVGELNDRFITDTLLQAKACGWKVLAGWGNEGAHRGRSARIARMLRESGVQAFCVHLCANGEPGHPLYVAYDDPLLPWPPNS